MSDDSLEPLITQCPKCDTRFRVTESQLQVASGRVRCGACLAVFEGTAHLTLDGEEMASAQVPDVDALLEELDEIGSHEPAEPPSLPVIGNEDLVALSAEAMNKDGDESDLPPELLALEAELMDELRLEEVPPPLNPGPLELVRDVAEPSLDEPIEEPFGIQVPEVIDDDQDGDWLDEVASDMWEDGDAAETPADASTPTAPEATTASEFDDAQPEADGAVSVALDASDVSDSSDSSGFGEEVIELEALNDAAPGVAKATLASLAAERAAQYEGELYEDEVPKQKFSLLTIGLILLALIGLPGQVLWFQYESWVMDESIRPVYQVACGVLGCELPPMRDVSMITSKKSFIRSHPDRQDARVVDVLMVNNADFPQPFPLIELVATTLNGDLVAGRRFKPEEYLQGEVKPTSLLQSRTPIHVSLEIQDPGEEALNFEVHFR